MAAINSGMMPKGLAPGLAGALTPSPTSNPPLRARRSSKGQGLLAAVKRALRGTVATHNCGGMAHHDGSRLAHPTSRL